MKVRRARPVLGTLVDIEAAGRDCGDALEAAFAAVAQVHRLMSAQDPQSDLSRINCAGPGEVVEVHAWTLEVLEHASRISLATSGLFDCRVAPLTQPRLSELEPLAGAVRVRRPVQLTLDGIAKGFAVDRAITVLQAFGMSRGAVNAGGDLRFFGPQAQPVYVRDPARPQRLLPIGEFREAAVATSAPYFPEGKLPIVDPRTGEGCDIEASATVIARDCITADALTKPVLIDPARAHDAVERLGARAIRIARGQTAP